MTPEALRDALLLALQARRTKVRLLRRYADGDHPLPQGLTQVHSDGQQEMERIFHRLLRESRSNWCGLVVDAVDERLAVDGFRFGDDHEAAQDVWKLWQANQLDADSLLAHNAALSTGQAFVTVWPGEPYPTIDVEDPCQVIVAYAPGSRKLRLAALKEWTDGGDRFITLHTPEFLYKWVSAEESGFNVRAVPGEESPLPNPMGVVSVIELRANPVLRACPYGGGRAEHEYVVDIQDRINETVFGRLMATYFAAFKQKWATGIEIPVDDAGKPIQDLKLSISKVWRSESEEARFGEFSETDIRQYIDAAEADIQHLAAISKTPPHYLLGKMANLSGDALKVAETGLISKVGRHKRFFGEAWEEVARLAVKAWRPDDRRAMDVTAEVVWRDTESRSFGETVDGLIKLAAGLQIPPEALWEKIPGVTQTEIDRWKTMQAADALLQPPPPPPGVTPPTGV